MAVSAITWLPWQWALDFAAMLLVVSVALRVGGRRRFWSAGVAEIAALMALYAAWQFAGSLSAGGLDGAESAGLWLSEVENFLQWPSEAAIQSPVLDHEWVMRAADTYYATAHVPVFLMTLAWIFIFRRPDWPFARTTIVLTTAVCLVIQYKPVAPPRLIPELGVVDTAARTGLSVYGALPGANQYAAMPSVHVAWAAAVALLIVVVGRSRWRWLAVAYPVTTMWVVVVTGNHFLIDGWVAIAVLALAAAATYAVPSQRPTRVRLHGSRTPTRQALRASLRDQEPGGVEVWSKGRS